MSENDVYEDMKRIPAWYEGKVLVVSHKGEPVESLREMRWVETSPNGQYVRLVHHSSQLLSFGAAEWWRKSDIRIHDMLRESEPKPELSVRLGQSTPKKK